MANSQGITLFHRAAGVSDESDDTWDDTALIEAYDKAIGLAKEEVARRMGVGVPTDNPEKSHPSPVKKDEKFFQWKAGAPCRAIYRNDRQCYEATIQSIYADGKTCVVRFIGYNNEEEVPVKSLQASQGKTARKMQKARARIETEAADGVQQPAPKTNSHKDIRKESHNSSSKRPKHRRQDTHGNAGGHGSHGAPYCWSMPPNHPMFPPMMSGPQPLQMPFMPQMTAPFSMPFKPAPFASAPWNSHLMPPPPPPPIPSEDVLENDSEALNAMLMSWYMSGYHTGFYNGLRHAQKKLSSSLASDVSKETASSTQDSS